MDTIQVLTRVRGYLSNPDNWCTGIMQDGRRRCLIAAILDVAALSESHSVFEALQNNSNLGVPCPVSSFIVAGLNDRCTHDEMLAWVDRTLVAERAKRGVEALKDEIRTIPITEAAEPKTEILVH